MMCGNVNALQMSCQNYVKDTLENDLYHELPQSRGGNEFCLFFLFFLFVCCLCFTLVGSARHTKLLFFNSEGP